jgi:mRNA-degrading endonuclease RelE of RelBE toxin-antitoxin system
VQGDRLDGQAASGYYLARMACRVTFAPEAWNDYRHLKAYLRTEVQDAINRHLVHEPTRVSRSRIRRLRGTRRPQYRLRVGEVRVFYDVHGNEVEVLAVVEKSRAESWLRSQGEYDEESSTG